MISILVPSRLLDEQIAHGRKEKKARNWIKEFADRVIILQNINIEIKSRISNRTSIAIISPVGYRLVILALRPTLRQLSSKKAGSTHDIQLSLYLCTYYNLTVRTNGIHHHQVISLPEPLHRQGVSDQIYIGQRQKSEISGKGRSQSYHITIVSTSGRHKNNDSRSKLRVIEMIGRRGSASYNIQGISNYPSQCRRSPNLLIQEIRTSKPWYVIYIQQIVVVQPENENKIIHKKTSRSTRRLSCVKPETMNSQEEYDPERPYQGRPDQKMAAGKIPFTGHFDPLLQRYTIENFDADTFQTREGADPSIVIASKPDHVKRLDAIPFSGDESKREAEISHYLAQNHHVTYASLQNPNGLNGQIEWRQPKLIKFVDPQKLGYNTVEKPVGHQGYTTQHANVPRQQNDAHLADLQKCMNVDRHIKTDTSKPEMIVVPLTRADSVQAGKDPRQMGRDPRLRKIAEPEAIRNTYNLRPSNTPMSTRPVDPVALATKPIFKPAMERVSRDKQIAQRNQAGSNFIDAVTKPIRQAAGAAIQGMFRKAQPNRAPKGSRNIPLRLAEHTAIPAQCWPLLQEHEANINMWSTTGNQASDNKLAWSTDKALAQHNGLIGQTNPLPDHPVKSTNPDKTNIQVVPDVASLMELVEPVSPLAKSPNRESHALEKTGHETSLEIQIQERSDLSPRADNRAIIATDTCPHSNSNPPSTTTKTAQSIAKPNTCSTSELPSQSTLATTKRSTTELEQTAQASTMSETETDMDTSTVAGGKRVGGATEQPIAKRIGISALAEAYKAKVEQTKASLVLKNGGGPLNPQPSLEGHVETEYINEVVKVNPTPIATTTYATAPLLTLRELLPAGAVEDAPQDLESTQLDQVFRAKTIEFVVMIKPLPKDGQPAAVEWEFPDSKLFENIMNHAFAEFIDPDITRMDIIKWSSVGTQTGIGSFMATTNQLDLVQIFRDTIPKKVHEGNMAESFPKQTMISDYGITLYAHGGTIAYRPSILLAMILRTYQKDFAGECEVLKADKFPSNHPYEGKRNARIISLLPDQVFLDHLQKFPANFAFSAGFCKRLYIRGGSRINPKDPQAKKPERRPRFGRAAITKLLLDNQKEIMKKGEEEQEVAERMGQATI